MFHADLNQSWQSVSTTINSFIHSKISVVTKNINALIKIFTYSLAHYIQLIDIVMFHQEGGGHGPQSSQGGQRDLDRPGEEC